MVCTRSQRPGSTSVRVSPRRDPTSDDANFVAGESGFKVCRFALVRMDGQPPIPIQAGREDEAAKIIAVRLLSPFSRVGST